MLLATLTIWLSSDAWNLCSFHRLCLHKNTLLTVTTNIKHILVPVNCPSGRSPRVLFVKDLPIYECSFFTEPFESITYLSLRQKVMLGLKLLSTPSNNRNCSLSCWLSLPGGCPETARTTLTIYERSIRPAGISPTILPYIVHSFMQSFVHLLIYSGI